jgi:hypothetical protein
MDELLVTWEAGQLQRSKPGVIKELDPGYETATLTSTIILITDLIISGGFHHAAAGGHASCHAGTALPLQAEYQEWN